MPPLDRRPQAASEARLLVQVEPGLPGNRAVELRPTDDAPVDQDLAELFSALGLVEQRLVELAVSTTPCVTSTDPSKGRSPQFSCMSFPR
jgi:hypothetical protein